MTRPVRPLVVDERHGHATYHGGSGGVRFDPVDVSLLYNYTKPDVPVSAYGLREMNAAEMDALHAWVRYLYATNPSVTLSYVGSGGNLGTMTDTRLQAGAYLTRVERFPTEGETAEPSTVSVNYSRIEQTIASGLGIRNSFPRPLFMDYFSFSTPKIRRMSMAEVFTYIIRPPLMDIASSLNYSGGYTFWNQTASSYIGATTWDGGSYTDIGTIYNDTRANTGAYTAGGIPEALDQPFTATQYKLLYGNPSPTAQRPEMMVYNESPNSIRRYDWPSLNIWLKELVRYYAANNLSYSINGPGNFAQGVTISDTKLNGAGNYQTRYVNTNDYRAQEFPDGTSVAQNTYQLKADL